MQPMRSRANLSVSFIGSDPSYTVLFINNLSCARQCSSLYHAATQEYYIKKLGVCKAVDYALYGIQANSHWWDEKPLLKYVAVKLAIAASSSSIVVPSLPCPISSNNTDGQFLRERTQASWIQYYALKSFKDVNWRVKGLNDLEVAISWHYGLVFFRPSRARIEKLWATLTLRAWRSP
jgi:hypothetical protein